MFKTVRNIAGLLLIVLVGLGVGAAIIWQRFGPRQTGFHPVSHPAALVPAVRLSSFQRAVVQDLARQKRVVTRYRDGYYTGGDPPPNIGVCTDVVIRAFRGAGVDLQRAVTTDIRARPDAYRISRPDPNIDHRRCRNLVCYFRAYAVALPTSGAQADWQPGDIVFWDISGHGKPEHVGMIGNGRDADGNPTVVHHWPGCPVAETDGLYGWTVRYHFRWKG
jgi:uncharacterized protein YijF (DUF1287 family)